MAVTSLACLTGGLGAGAEINSCAGIGTKKLLASSGVARSHAFRRSGGTITNERFSSPGLWKVLSQ